MPEDTSAVLCCAWGTHPAVLAAAPRLLHLPAATHSRWQGTQSLHTPELQPVSLLALEAPLVLCYRLALGTRWESNWPKQAGSWSPDHWGESHESISSWQLQVTLLKDRGSDNSCRRAAELQQPPIQLPAPTPAPWELLVHHTHRSNTHRSNTHRSPVRNAAAMDKSSLCLTHKLLSEKPSSLPPSKQLTKRVLTAWKLIQSYTFFPEMLHINHSLLGGAVTGFQNTWPLWALPRSASLGCTVTAISTAREAQEPLAEQQEEAGTSRENMSLPPSAPHQRCEQMYFNFSPDSSCCV